MKSTSVALKGDQLGSETPEFLLIFSQSILDPSWCRPLPTEAAAKYSSLSGPGHYPLRQQETKPSF